MTETVKKGNISEENLEKKVDDVELTIPPYLLMPSNTFSSRASVEYDAKRTMQINSDGTRRNTINMLHRKLDHPTDIDSKPYEKQFASIHTLYDLIKHSEQKYADHNCFGEPGPYVYETYKEIGVRRDNIGSGLVQLGLKRGTTVGLYSKNKVEWIVAEFGINAHSGITVPLYDSLGDDSVVWAINHSELTILVCTTDKIEKLSALSTQIPCLKTLVIIEESIPEDLLATAKNAGLNVYTFKEVEKMGADKPVCHDPPKPTDLFTVSYTSGSTGMPKGVMLTHANMIGVMGGYRAIDGQPGFDEVTCLKYPVRVVSYLPLAHVSERSLEYMVLAYGGEISFYRGIVPELFDDIVEAKPTGFCGVPRVFQAIVQKIQHTVASSGLLKRNLFNWAYAGKLAALRNGSQAHWLWDPLVFNKLKGRMGGEIDYAVSAGAPLDPQIAEFFTVAFGVPVVQGYGLTETSGGIAFTFFNDCLRKLTVGPPTTCCEIKLQDVPDMGYLVTDVPNPRGEILIRGPSVSPGYYKDPELTKQSYTEDGFLKTGDVGMWEKDGNLSIIDRVKNLIKLSQGEYVRSEHVEAVYCRSALISQVFAHGGAFSRYLTAVVVPEKVSVMNLAKSKGIAGDFCEVIKDPGIVTAIEKDGKLKAEEADLKGFEKIKQMVLEPEPFSVENGLLTPTFKLRRKQAREKYGDMCQKLATE